MGRCGSGGICPAESMLVRGYGGLALGLFLLAALGICCRRGAMASRRMCSFCWECLRSTATPIHLAYPYFPSHKQQASSNWRNSAYYKNQRASSSNRDWPNSPYPRSKTSHRDVPP
jgi:hypothetical protein